MCSSTRQSLQGHVNRKTYIFANSLNVVPQHLCVAHAPRPKHFRPQQSQLQYTANHLRYMPQAPVRPVKATLDTTSPSCTSCQLSFIVPELPFEPSKGYRVAILGSLHELGGWTPERAIFMDKGPDGYWHCQVRLRPEWRGTIEYKVVLVKGYSCKWEPGSNRRLNVPDDLHGLSELNLVCSWGEPDVQAQADLSLDAAVPLPEPNDLLPATPGPASAEGEPSTSQTPAASASPDLATALTQVRQQAAEADRRHRSEVAVLRSQVVALQRQLAQAQQAAGEAQEALGGRVRALEMTVLRLVDVTSELIAAGATPADGSKALPLSDADEGARASAPDAALDATNVQALSPLEPLITSLLASHDDLNLERLYEQLVKSVDSASDEELDTAVEKQQPQVPRVHERSRSRPSASGSPGDEPGAPASEQAGSSSSSTASGGPAAPVTSGSSSSGLPVGFDMGQLAGFLRSCVLGGKVEVGQRGVYRLKGQHDGGEEAQETCASAQARPSSGSGSSGGAAAAASITCCSPTVELMMPFEPHVAAVLRGDGAEGVSLEQLHALVTAVELKPKFTRTPEQLSALMAHLEAMGRVRTSGGRYWWK